MEYLTIDADGFFTDKNVKLLDNEFGKEALSNLTINENWQLKTKVQNKNPFILAFDEPFISQKIEKTNTNIWKLHLPYGHIEDFSLEGLRVDEWDRFHGRTTRGVPFLITEKNQMEFFDLLDEFDDESITHRGEVFKTPFLYDEPEDITTPQRWTEAYNQKQDGWDLGKPAKPLTEILGQLKLNKLRILVLGCGRGHDAAYFASLGHIVTAVDFSEVAIKEARELYSNQKNLIFFKSDVFALPEEFNSQFDIVFEHTCFCAVSPLRRGDLVEVWKKCLVPGGHLLGILFTFSKTYGPPYGSSEWELKKRLSSDFNFMYWTRWPTSLPKRIGKELVIYAQRA